jgi:hypothetical protein
MGAILYCHIAQKIILPGLMNKIDTFPISFKELLLKYSEGLKRQGHDEGCRTINDK